MTAERCYRAVVRIVHVWAAALATLLAGSTCTVLDPNHCGNRDKNATCRMLYDDAPVCDLCVATRNGCIESSLVPSCPAEDPGASTDEATGSGHAQSASSGDETGTRVTTSDPTAASASGTGDTSSTSPTSSTSDDEGPLDEGSTTKAETDSTTFVGETEEAICGDGSITPPEQCDGEDLGGATCAEALGDPHWRGELSCTGTCELTTVNCCRGTGAPCLPLLNSCCNQCILLPVGGGLGVCN